MKLISTGKLSLFKNQIIEAYCRCVCHCLSLHSEFKLCLHIFSFQFVKVTIRNQLWTLKSVWTIVFVFVQTHADAKSDSQAAISLKK